MASVALDPLGGVSAVIDSLPQGQGHKTVVAATVAAIFGLDPALVRVEATLDTGRDAWSIAAGNYSSRFAGAVAGAAYLAAVRLRERLARIAAPLLNLRPEEIVFAGGRIGAADNPQNSLSFARIAAVSHWAPETVPEPALREWVAWSPEGLGSPNEKDEINSSAVHGFVFDLCGVEVDRDTGVVRVDRYATMHDAGRILSPMLYDGQVMGGFAHGIGAALKEAFVYDRDGALLTGSFLDYAVPRASDVPSPIILHQETPSPVTPLGAKGVAEGNSMSTPVCIANAVADALGVDDVSLPLTPAKVRELLRDV
jgi:2-furoyl-CoA dehydrogenase large subunit